MKKVTTGLLVLCWVLGMTGPAAGEQPPTAGAATAETGAVPNPQKKQMKRVVMARVGDNEITVAQFMQFITTDVRLVKLAEKPAGKARVLRLMITDGLLRMAMEQEGMLPEGRDLDSLTPDEYFAAYDKLLEKHLADLPPPSVEDLYAYYKAHPEKYTALETVRVTQIQLRIPKDAGEPEIEEIRAKAEGILNRLEAGESAKELAAAYTENPLAKVASGDLGFLPRSTDPWLKAALEGMKVGQHTGVLKSSTGFEILVLEDQRDEFLMPFANVRDKVKASVIAARSKQAKEAYLAELANTFGVEILMPGLEAANPAIPLPH